MVSKGFMSGEWNGRKHLTLKNGCGLYRPRRVQWLFQIKIVPCVRPQIASFLEGVLEEKAEDL